MIQAHRSRIGGAAFGARRKRYDNVLAFCIVDAIHVHQDSAFFDSELRSFTDGQSNCMLPVFGTDVKDDAIGFKDILQAQRPRVIRAARNGLHLKKLASLIGLEIVSVGKRRENKNCAQYNGGTDHLSSLGLEQGVFS